MASLRKKSAVPGFKKPAVSNSTAPNPNLPTPRVLEISVDFCSTNLLDCATIPVTFSGAILPTEVVELDCAS